MKTYNYAYTQAPMLYLYGEKTDSPDKKKVKRVRAVSVVLALAAVLLTLGCFAMFVAGFPGASVMFYMALTASLLLCTYLALWNLCHSKKCARIATALRECFLIFLAVCIAGFVVLQGLIMSGSQYDGATADVIVVLGAGIYGEIPSRILTSRLDAAIEYQKTHGDVMIVVSGGQGKGESITEAEAMSRYLVRRGVNESSILKEERSTNTRENLAFSIALMAEHGLEPEETSVSVVTNEFHLYRAKRVAARLEVDAGGIPAKTPSSTSRVIYQCREAVAVLFDFFTGLLG